MIVTDEMAAAAWRRYWGHSPSMEPSPMTLADWRSVIGAALEAGPRPLPVPAARASSEQPSYGEHFRQMVDKIENGPAENRTAMGNIERAQRGQNGGPSDG
jgi:hypothetical protein